MSFIKNLFSKKADSIKSYEDFWNWFQNNEKSFFDVVKHKGAVEPVFFDKLSPKLNALRHGFFYLTGMFDENTCELVITADGTIKNIVFVEELVGSAPKIDGWKFTALKPALDIKGVDINMAGFKFNSENLSFYPNEHPDYPDEIDLTIVHGDYAEENKNIIVGTNIFLENYLGELELVDTIDNISIIGKDSAEKELIPISKLKDYLNWRQKEFIERYERVRRDTENDLFSTYSATLENGRPVFAAINSSILNWESKASHPWILSVEIKYDGENNNGMPDDYTYKLLDEIEDKISEDLKDFDGYINVGRETADSVRQIYFACREFRKPSKVLDQVKSLYSNKLNLDFDIYKDKYWQTFNRYN